MLRLIRVGKDIKVNIQQLHCCWIDTSIFLSSPDTLLLRVLVVLRLLPALPPPGKLLPLH
jgi:hypothetical protein